MSPRKLSLALRAICRLPAMLAFAIPFSVQALGVQTATLSGVIEEQHSSLRLPGVLVQLTNASQSGEPAATHTDEEGRFQLSAIPPGDYDLVMSWESITPLRQRITVRPGDDRKISVRWRVQDKDEVQSITERLNPTRPETTRTGQIFGADTLRRIPTRRYVEDLLQQVPGITDPYQTALRRSVKGGMGVGNVFLIDGLNVSDPVAGNGTSDINFDSLSHIEVITGGMEAEYNTLGGVINVTTLNGAPKKWSVDASLYGQHQALEVQERVGTGPANGRRPFARAPYYSSQFYVGNLNLGGPLIANRLWIHTSVQYGYSELYVPEGPPLEVQHPGFVAHNLVAHAKLTYAPHRNHRLNFSVRTGYLPADNTEQSNDVQGIAEDARRQMSTVGALRWDATLSKNVQLVTHASFQYMTIDNLPQSWVGGSDLGQPDQPRHQNLDDDTTWYQGSMVRKTRRAVVQVDPTLEIFGRLLGWHHLKLGVQTRLLSDQKHVELAGGSAYSDRGGGPGEAGLCQPASPSGKGCYSRIDMESHDSEARGLAAGVFLQDRWRPIPRLTLLPGVRLDYGASRNTLGEDVTAKWTLVPRIGFTLDVLGDQNTIITGFYGRTSETAALLPATMARPTGRTRVYLYDQGTKEWVFLLERGGRGGYHLDPEATPPTVDEVTASVRQNLFGSVTLMADYTYRHLSYLWDQEEQNRIWDPSGTWIAGYKNGKPQDVSFYTTQAENERTYHGLDLSLAAQHRGLEIFAAYTLSWLYGTTQDAFGQLYGSPHSSPRHNPRLDVYARGFLPEDTRHQLRLRASYETHGVNIGLTLYYGSGTPITPRYYNPGDMGYSLLRAPIGLALGSDRNDPAQFSELRNPDRVVANARLSWDLKPLIRQQIVLVADVFNLFNQRTPLELESRDIATFGQGNNRPLPLSVQLGVRYVH